VVLLSKSLIPALTGVLPTRHSRVVIRCKSKLVALWSRAAAAAAALAPLWSLSLVTLGRSTPDVRQMPSTRRLLGHSAHCMS
jgi:hypothetical protein